MIKRKRSNDLKSKIRNRVPGRNPENDIAESETQDITFSELLYKYCDDKGISTPTLYNYRIRLGRSNWEDYPVAAVTEQVWSEKRAEIEQSAAESGKSGIWAYQVSKMLCSLLNYAKQVGLTTFDVEHVKKNRRVIETTSAMPPPLRKIKRELQTEGITFGDLFRAFIDHHAKLHYRRWQDADRAYKYYLTHWDGKIAANIAKSEVQELHGILGRENGVTTANRVVQLIKSVYYKGLEWEIYEGPNPAKGIKLFRLQSRDRFLETDEIRQLLLAITTLRNETTRDFLLMCLLTAARRSNVAAMRWEQISFENKFWSIPLTKNGTAQKVPLTDWAVEILKARLKTRVGDWVFPSDRSQSGHLTKPEGAWQQLKIRTGIQNIRMHDLRRTLASWEAMTGANLSVIAATLNHKDFKSVQVYARLNLDPVRDAMDKATTKMFSGIKKNIRTSKDVVNVTTILEYPMDARK